MKGLRVFWRDLRQAVRRPMTLLTLVAVAFIPILYSGMLIRGSWDPYGQLSRLPVAVVNLDQGAEYEGTTMEVGRDFVEELQRSGDFQWHFVSAADAQNGMVHNKYYMTVTVPADFSRKATTLMQATPEQAEILFEPNGDYNFIAGQIGNSAVKDLKTKLSQKITEAYTRSLFQQIGSLSAGLGEAGSGAERLQDGAAELRAGLDTFESNLEKLADGSGQLARGLPALQGGAAQVAAGSGTVAGGARELGGGLAQLAAGAAQLQAGAADASGGADRLALGLQQAASGVQGLDAGLSGSAAASAKLAGGAAEVSGGLAKLLAANPQLAADAQLQQLAAASQAVADGAKLLSETQQQLAAGAAQLDAGQQQLAAGAIALQTGVGQLNGGLQQVSAKLADAAAGSAKLAAGAGELQGGAAQLQTGLDQFAAGVSGVAEGAVKLNEGSAQLGAGAGSLADGSGQLAAKLGDAAAQTAQVTAKDETVSMFAQPVQVTEVKDRKVTQYGQGIAPYFLSMALFVGGLVFTTVVSARESSVPNATRLGRFLSRTLTFLGMSVLQSTIAALIVRYGLELPIRNTPMFFVFMLFIGLTFTAIIQALVTWFDQPGRFIIILLMVTQLTSSAGTFPRELLPLWMQQVNPYLPMTHSIAGLKAVILSGDLHEMWKQAAYLGAFFAAFLLLTLFYFIRPNRTLSRETDTDSGAVMA